MDQENESKAKTWTFNAAIPLVTKNKLGSFLLFFLTGSLLACSDPLLDVIVEVNEEFEGVKRVEVDASFLEAVYTGDAQRERVTLQGIIRANRDVYQITHRLEGDVLKVRVESKGFGRSARGEGHIYLSGPEEMELRLVGGSGNVSAEHIHADNIELSVGSGSVSLRDAFAEYIHLEAVSGKVIGEDLTGAVSASISSGNLQLDRVTGNLNAEGSSGNMKLAQISGLVNAKNSSGNVSLDQVAALGKFTLSSGNLSVKRSGLSSESSFKVSSGNISIQTGSPLDQFNYEIKSGSGKVRVGNSQGSGTLVINNNSPYTIKGEANSGNIEIVN